MLFLLLAIIPCTISHTLHAACNELTRPVNGIEINTSYDNNGKPVYTITWDEPCGGADTYRFHYMDPIKKECVYRERNDICHRIYNGKDNQAISIQIEAKRNVTRNVTIASPGIHNYLYLCLILHSKYFIRELVFF